MLVDAGGLLLSLFAVWFAERPAPPEKTYGYYRVEILAALVNGVVLCLLALAILVKAYERLGHPQPVPGGPILVGGGGGARGEPAQHAACSTRGPRRASTCGARTSRCWGTR